MASLLQNKQSKRRIRSSSSSISSETSSVIYSPTSKKPRNVEEEEDDVMTALNIAEGLNSKLEEILAKMSKLDVINESVQKIERTLLKLDRRIVTLEDFQKYASKEIDDLKQSANFIDSKVDSEIKSAKDALHKANNTVKESSYKQQGMEDKLKKYEEQLEKLKDRDLYLEAYSRRENIKFLNIEEDDDEDTEEKLRSFLREHLSYQDYENVEIQRVHRNGKKGIKPRPILARFLRYKDVTDILSLGRYLKQTQYAMFTDLPYELVARRKLHMATFKKAKLNKIPAAFSRSEPDKLYIRGKEWPVGKELII